MARFAGKIGFGESAENPSGSGVWKDVITEYEYFGDVTRYAGRFEQGEKINNDISLENSISIVADEYANEHIFAMRYVEFRGARWTVSKVEVAAPRLILRLGGIYNGPIAT
jgi:hypothetical protein